jgi:hypothetical protein
MKQFARPHATVIAWQKREARLRAGDRATQYAAAYRLNRQLPGVLDRPLSRTMTPNLIS